MNTVGDVLANMVARDRLPERSLAAIAAGLEEANDRLAEALAGHYWRKPYLLSQLLLDCPIWPCGHDLEDLLFLCRVRKAEQKNRAGYTAISLRAADLCLQRMMKAAAALERAATT